MLFSAVDVRCLGVQSAVAHRVVSDTCIVATTFARETRKSSIGCIIIEAFGIFSSNSIELCKSYGIAKWNDTPGKASSQDLFPMLRERDG